MFFIFDFVATVIVLIILAFMSVITVFLFCWILFFNTADRFRIGRPLIVVPWCFIINRLLLFMRIKVIGKEFVDPKRTTLYICNHQSLCDITTFVRFSKAAAIAKEEVKSLPFLGPVTYYTGNLYFKRESRSDRMGIIKEVRTFFTDGHSLCLFPEGTRSSANGDLLPPNMALIKLCYKMNVSVVPTAIEGTRFILPKGRFNYNFFKKVILKYNPPVSPADFDNSDDFCNACWGTVETTYNELRENYAKY